MTQAPRLCLVLHHHQPFGNLESAFEAAFVASYQPLLEWLEQSGLRVGLHFSGALLEWLLARKPEALERIRRLRNQQLELLGGPIYAPLLPMIPRQDAIDQCVAMNQWLLQHLGCQATGAWLPEGAWEPGLVSVLHQAGLAYTLLDEGQFIAAGIETADLNRAFITEDAAHTLAVLPCSSIAGQLGHVPVALVMQQLQARPGLTVLVSSAERWTQKTLPWLYEFSAQLQSSQHMVLPAEAVAANQTRPWVHLPASASWELARFSLPEQAAAVLNNVPEALRPFLRGGSWQAFGRKHPEVRHLSNRMLRVSKKLHAANRVPEHAWQALWRAQAGNAYWHGTLGGASENYLRSSVYQQLILAENALEPNKYGWLETENVDFDFDGLDEMVVESHTLNLYFQPKSGGALVELDHRARAFNLLDVFFSLPDPVSRRAQPARWSLLDHFVGAETGFAEFRQGQALELGDFLGRSYQASKYRDRVSLSAQGFVRGPIGEPVPVEIKKTVQVLHKETTLAIEYRIINLGQTDIITRFGCEWNFGLLTPDAPGRQVLVNDRPAGNFGSSCEHRNVQIFALKDAWLGLELLFDFGRELLVWQHPCQTLEHNDQQAIERYQSTLVMPLWDLDLPKGRSRRIHFQVQLKTL